MARNQLSARFGHVLRMRLKLISQEGRGALVCRWEMVGSKEVECGRMGVFGVQVAVGVCVPLSVKRSSGVGCGFLEGERFGAERFALRGAFILTCEGT